LSFALFLAVPNVGTETTIKDLNFKLEEALELFNMPRTIGETDDFGVIKANYGRFGPYFFLPFQM
jgi:topoisomerase IA-like protein